MLGVAPICLVWLACMALLQEDDMDADMWESVPGSVDDVSAGGAAAGSSQGGSLAAALDAPIDDDEDWEDVV